MKKFFFIFTCLASTYAAAAAEAPKLKEPELEYVHNTRANIPGSEIALNFGALYAFQWGVYIVHQHDKVISNGSFENWRKNPFRPVFDKDNIKFNLFWHTVTGEGYYLFYRSRGYSEVGSFLWAVTSSLAFEFTIETLTEPPSFQDIYQTPVFGTVVGMAAERLSCYFHSQGTWPARALGYLFNPLTLLPFSNYKFQATPIAGNGQIGALVSLEF